MYLTRDICVPVASVAFRSRLRSADFDDEIVPPLPRSFRFVTRLHPRHGICCHLISRTETFVTNSSNQALRSDSLCKPSHRRRLWELGLSGALQKNAIELIDWLIDWLIDDWLTVNSMSIVYCCCRYFLRAAVHWHLYESWSENRVVRCSSPGGISALFYFCFWCLFVYLCVSRAISTLQIDKQFYPVPFSSLFLLLLFPDIAYRRLQCTLQYHIISYRRP